MKTLTNFLELTIIVCVAILIILPELLYSCLLRLRDRLEEVAGEL